MPTPSYPASKSNYDPRWFIWTIVFLVTTGISLVAFIALSDSGTNDVPSFHTARASAHTTTTPSASTRKTK